MLESGTYATNFTLICMREGKIHYDFFKILKLIFRNSGYEYFISYIKNKKFLSYYTTETSSRVDFPFFFEKYFHFKRKLFFLVSKEKSSE